MTTSYSSAAESKRLARTPEDTTGDAKRPNDRKFAALPLLSKKAAIDWARRQKSEGEESEPSDWRSGSSAASLLTHWYSRK